MLASLTPCLRHRSATATPASCSFNIPMICSSEKRLRFMLWSSYWARTNFKLSKGQGQVKAERPNVPVIMITAYGNDATRKRAIELGAAGLLAKPTDLGFLREEINQ